MLSCPKRHIYKKFDFLRPYRESILCFKVNIQGTNSQIFKLQEKLTTDLFIKTKQVFGIYKLLEGMKLSMKIKNQQDATIRYLLLTFVSICFGHHYAHLKEIKDRVTAFGVLLWF